VVGTPSEGGTVTPETRTPLRLAAVQKCYSPTSTGLPKNRDNVFDRPCLSGSRSK